MLKKHSRFLVSRFAPPRPDHGWLGLIAASTLCFGLAACAAQISGSGDDAPGGSDSPSQGGGSVSQPGAGMTSTLPGAGSGNPNPGAGGGGGTSPLGNGGVNSGAGNGSSGSGSGAGTAGMTSTPLAPSALPAESACVSNQPGPRVLRRLTAAEFKQSVIDLFGGDSSVPLQEVFNDQKILGFTVDSSALMVQDLNADQLMSNAEAVADWAKSRLSQLSSCQTLDANCAKTFIKSFGRKAFRTTLADGDARIDTYSKLFMAESSFADGAASVITAMLQSPYFLYRTELGPDGASGGTVTLTPFEVASALSYLLTGSTPDSTLLDAADQVSKGSTKLADMVDQQANRLLSQPAAQNAVMNFMTGWLGLDRLQTTVKDNTVFMLPDATRADMGTETRMFLLDAFNSNGSVGSLFTANYTFLNQNLASYYGVNANGAGSSFQKVTLSSGRDGGLLAQGGILTGYAKADISSPTQRGHLVRSRLLCQDIPPPPAGLDTKFQPSGTAKTTREKYAQEHAAPDRGECYGCHKMMDLIGFSFEHYDAFGRYRTQEAGENIDSTGTIIAANATDGDVNVDGLSGANGLQSYLANNQDLKHCLVRYWSYYAYGSPSWTQDACTYNSIQQEADKNSFALKSVLMGIIHAARFTSRVQDQ